MERELPGLQLQTDDPLTCGVFPMGGIVGGDVPLDEDGRFTIDVARGRRDWGSTTDAEGRVTLFGSPGNRRVEARREDRDEWRRALVELGTVELRSEPSEPLTLRLPPEWRELPK